jgi:small subunit ribosomal protein S4
MATLNKPRLRRARRVGTDLNQTWSKSAAEKCNLSQRPGQHGLRRVKDSQYGEQLNMKQMIRYSYNLTEKQFKLTYKKAESHKGPIGLNLIRFLESRLDNMVYRLGFAFTRAQARQMVSHKHVLVNGACVNIPSYIVKLGDIVSVREKSKSHERVEMSMKNATDKKLTDLDWVEVDFKSFSGKIVRLPELNDISSEFQPNQVVELYSK